MLKSVLASRGFLSVAGAVLVAALAVGAYLVVADPLKKMVGYCAIMPDAVGLYTGNHVTLRGIPVGTVTAIRPENTGVRVDFEVDAEHRLYGKVAASTVADTVVADRNLAVASDTPDAAAWEPATCLSETFTPKSLSQTLDAFSQLADQLNGANTPGEQHRVEGALEALDRATSGTGPTLNTLIAQLSSALKSPDAAIGHIGALVDAIGSLSASVATNWADIRLMLTQFGPGVQLINEVWDYVVTFIDSLLILLPWLNGITRKYGGLILEGLDATLPYLRMIGSNVGSLQQLLTMIPALGDAFEQTIDPETGAARITYAVPRTDAPIDIMALLTEAVGGR